jgi:hypothetical protein
MSNWKNLIFKDEPAAPPDPKIVRRRTILLSLPFIIVGILALVFLLHDEVGSGFRMEKQKAMGLLSAAVVCGGLIALIFGVSAKKMHALKPGPKKPADDGKPWLKREEWAAGRITSGTRKGVVLLWIFTFLWNAISAPIVFIGLPAELHKGNDAILIALLFPIVGLGMIIFAAKTTLAWKRFGQTIFEMAAIPGALGGTLEGEISVKTKLQPQHGLHLRLSCIRQTTSGSGKNRNTTEKILWQDEKWLRADLPQTDWNATGIPIYFKLPADKPESTIPHGDGIHWKLEASATLRGPNFHAAFDVPVFKLPEPPDISDDPTIQFQMSLDKIRKQLGSKIQVSDLPGGGKEFIFPAARNPGFAAYVTVFWLIWTGIVVALFWNWKQVPAIFPLLFGAFDLLITIFAFNLWFHRNRVVLSPKQVIIQSSWLGMKRQHTLAAPDAASFETYDGVSMGHQVYYDLKLKTRAGREFTAATYIPDKPEADWLARQMSAALKNIPATDSNS